MKKLSLYILGLLPILAIAQIDRSKAPLPSAAPIIKIGTPATFTLPNGLKVFVVENNKLPRVSASLTIDMDGIVEGEKTGVSQFSGSLMRRGTTKMKKEQLDEEIDFLGANINTSAFSAGASSLKNNFTKTIALMSDVVLTPSFPEDELEKIRKKEISNLKASEDDPNDISDNVSNHLVYGKNHPYGDIETEKTVNNISLSDIKNFYSTYWIPNNAYLVFVGNINVAEAKTLATKYFGGWKKGVIKKATYPTPKPPAKTIIAIVDRPASVQSLINFIAPVELRPGTPDAIPSTVMNNILGGGSSGRLFQNLREKHGFTYGAYSNLKSDRLIGAFSANASVRNEKTDSAISEFINEFEAIRNKALPDSDVINSKNFLSGNFARSLENPATIARFALDITRNKMPADYYQNYLKNLGAVNAATVQSIANKYVNPSAMYIVIVGNAKQIAKGLEKYGEVKYFDNYGNEVAAPTMSKAIDPGVSAESIIQKAVDAVGSASAMAAVKDVTMIGQASIMGREMTVSQKNIIPSAVVMEMNMGGMTMQKQMLKDGKYSKLQQGQQLEADEQDKEELNEHAAFFEDAFLLKQNGNKYEVTGIEQVNGKDVYAVSIKTAAGREFTNFYDKETGLKIKSSRVEESPMGQLTLQTFFNDYKDFNGVKIPTTMIIDLGQFKIESSFKDIKINSGLKPEDIQ